MNRNLCFVLALLALPAVSRADEDLPPGVPAAIKDEVQRTYRVALDGERCYLASTVGVVVADCRDPAKLRYVGALALPGSVNQITLAGGHLAIANGPSGVVLAEPGDRPRQVGVMKLTGAAMSVAAAGTNKLLVASGSAGLHLLDIRKPTAPRRLDHWETSGYARAVRVAGDLVALADGDEGIHLFRLKGEKLALLSTMKSRSPLAHAFDLAFSGPLLLVAGGQAGLLVFDVAKPDKPRPVAGLKMRDAARGVSVHGQRVAVADGTAGVAMVDISTPSVPRETGRYKPERSANRVLLAGELAYVANDYDGLLILRTPADGNPVPLGRLPAPKPKKK
jgi:hypothetical protein